MTLRGSLSNPTPISGPWAEDLLVRHLFEAPPVGTLGQRAGNDRWALPMQTAHDPQYLVKHLLSELPAVTERVKAMRQARGGTNVEDNKNRMFASQEAYLKVEQPPSSHPMPRRLLQSQSEAIWQNPIALTSLPCTSTSTEVSTETPLRDGD